MSPSISRYERRDVIAMMNRRSTWQATFRLIAVLVVAGLLAAWACQKLYPIISAGPAIGTPVVYADGKLGDLQTLCARYRSDQLMTGLKMEGETAELCGF